MKYINNPIVPFVLYLFYMFHQLVMPAETPLQTIAVAMFLIYAIVAAVKLDHRKYTFLLLLDIFLLIQILYFAFQYPYLQSESKRFVDFAINQFKSVLVTMMPIYTYFWYGINGRLTRNHIIWFSICFIVLSVPQFYYLAYTMVEKYSWINEYNETTNNTAYYFVQGCVFLPLIANRKLLSTIILFIIVFYLLLGVKRGAILCFVCMLPIYLRFFLKKSRLYVIPILMIVVLLATYWYIDYFSDMFYMQTRIEDTIEGNTSARDVIYSKIFDYMIGPRTSLISLLFGHGFNASVKISGGLAHSDWLELFAGFGLFSVLIYLMLMVSVFYIWKNTIYPDLKACLAIGLLIWFLQTIFSMAYESTSFQFLIIAGLCGISLQPYPQFEKIEKRH